MCICTGDTKKDGSIVIPNSLHHICAAWNYEVASLEVEGCQVNNFKQAGFSQLWMALVSEMKRLRASRMKTVWRKAEPITSEAVELKDFRGQYSTVSVRYNTVHERATFWFMWIKRIQKSAIQTITDSFNRKTLWKALYNVCWRYNKKTFR